MLNLPEYQEYEAQKSIGDYILTLATTLTTFQKHYPFSIHSHSRIDAVISKIKAFIDDCGQLKTIRNAHSLARSQEHCKTEIKAFRNELVIIFDDLEKSMLNLLESYGDEAQICIGEHISTLTTILKTFWTYYDLLMYVRDSDRRTEVIFAAQVKVSKDLQDYEDRLSDIHNDKVITGIKFGKNIKLPNLQTEIEFPGFLNRNKNNQWGREILLDRKILSKKQVKS